MKTREIRGVTRRLAQAVLALSLGAGVLLAGPAQGQTTGVLEQDSLALVAFYNSTNGLSWADNTNWLTGPVASWLGVTVRDGRVIALVVEVNQLKGHIPPEIGNLTFLEQLALSNNELSGRLPAEIGNLTSLNYLSLWNNQLSGSLPPEIGNLTSLEWLLLYQNKFNGSLPPGIGNLTNLEILWFSENQLSGSIPPEIGNLTTLRGLYLYNNQLSGGIPPEISNLNHLADLYLNNNQFSGSIPPGIGKLTSLRSLNLGSNQHSGSIPPEIGNLTTLQQLYLQNNQLSGSIPPEIGSLTNLETLWLSSNQLSGSLPPEIGNLSALWHLDLSSNSLSGAIPISFAQLRRLYRFFFNNTNLCVPHSPLLQYWLVHIDDIRGTGVICDDDTTPPECEIVEVVQGEHIKVRAQDTQSGLKEITVLKAVNATVTQNPFTAGSTDPVIVTASKNDPNKRAVLLLRITDVAGNITRCDPVLTTLEGEQPLAFRLDQNYPNPFNPTTTIPFAVPEAAEVHVVVYDVLGRVVVALVEERVEAGRYAAAWDGRDGRGRMVPSGVYVVRMEAGSFTQTRRMLLVK